MSTFCCRVISGGNARGKALVSGDDLCFYLVEPESGKVIEPGHSLEGSCVTGKVLVFGGGKGSSVVQMEGLYQLFRCNRAPSALVVKHLDTVLVATAIIMGVPLVDRVDPAFYDAVHDGDTVEVDVDRQLITVARSPRA